MSVRIQRLSKQFTTLRRKVVALREIDMEIRPGEFFVLLGPSGCGKSTLLNIIAGLEKPSAGAISFGDEIVADPSRSIFTEPRNRNVAFVFQNYALYPHMSVYDNIAFPLKIARAAKASIAESVRQAAQTLEISELLGSKPSELSGGQRQRVAIARAIVRKPNVFLLDEPLSNLDAQLRVSMRAELKNLQSRLGITTVYVTHDQVEAMSLGHRVAVLNAGSVEQIGTPRDLYDRPATPFVARFIGSPPMNLLPARLENDKLQVCDSSIDIPAGEKSRFAQYAGKPFLLGIRPEHLAIADNGKIETIVRSVEPLGRETIVYLAAGENLVAVLSGRDDFTEGTSIRLALDLSATHLFPLEQRP